MTGLISLGTATAIGAGVSAAAAGAGTVTSLMNANKNAAAQDAATRQAASGSMQQQALQAEIMRQQREFQVAGQYDADGNRIIYDPDTGWHTLLGDRGLARQGAERGAQDLEARKYFGRQQQEEDAAFRRRFAEGQVSNQLLDEMRFQYGAPTREGVVGANKIAGVTAASEPAEALKSGAAASNLRQQGTAGNLGTQYQDVDRRAAQGQRTALAQVDANPELYSEILDKWKAGKIANYTPLAQRASNVTNAPVPTSGQEALAAQLASRAQKPYQMSPYLGATTNAANKQLVDTLAANKSTFPTGAFASGAEALRSALKDITIKDKPTPWNEDARNDYAYNSWRF